MPPLPFCGAPGSAPRPPLAATAVLAAAVLAAAPAAGQGRAEAPPVRLSWVRGPGAHGCRGPQEIADQVAARLGKNPFATEAARSIDVYLTRGERGWRAEIFVRSPEGLVGSRELTSEALDCAPIEAAGVLALTGVPAPVFQQAPVTLLPFAGLGATFP